MRKKIAICTIFSCACLVVVWLFLISESDIQHDILAVYEFEVPNTSKILLAKEWSGFKLCGIDFYIKDESTETYITSVETNEYCPIFYGNYTIEWHQEYARVTYMYSSAGDIWKEVVLKY